MGWGALLLFLFSCNASDENTHYESTDSAHGPRISKEHMEAPPPQDTVPRLNQTRDSNPVDLVPPGSTDTAALNIQ